MRLLNGYYSIRIDCFTNTDGDRFNSFENILLQYPGVPRLCCKESEKTKLYHRVWADQVCEDQLREGRDKDDRVWKGRPG